jgi:hypothetical protein
MPEGTYCIVAVGPLGRYPKIGIAFPASFSVSEPIIPGINDWNIYRCKYINVSLGLLAEGLTSYNTQLGVFPLNLFSIPSISPCPLRALK